MRPHRKQSLWLAFWVHRISGLVLALFLPLHFFVLAQALRGAEELDNYLVLTANPLAKFAEMTLVFLLAVHLFGGLRLLALEFLPWNDRQKTLAALSTALAFFMACGFLMQAL